MSQAAASPGRPIDWDEVLQLIKAGRLDLAESRCLGLLTDSPQDAEVLFHLSVIAQQRGDWAKSLDFLRRAVQVEPKQAKYHSGVGDSLYMLERAGEAVGAYEKALAIDPGFKGALNNLAVLYGLAGRNAEAEPLLLRRLAQDPDEKETLLNLCSTLEQLDFREDDVVNYARRAVALSRDDPRPYRYLGKSLLRKGDLPAALDAMQTAAARAPRDPEAHYGIGVVQIELDHVPEAVQAFQTALAIDPRHGKTYYALAEFLYRLDELAAAEEACLHARETLDDKISVEYLLAKIQFALGRYADAKHTYDHYRELYHRHRSQVTGQRPPGGKAFLLPVERVDEWCRRKQLPLTEVLPEITCPQAELVRFGNTPPELGFPDAVVPHAYVAEIRQAVILPGHEVVLVEHEQVALYDRLIGLQDRNNLMEDDVVRLADAHHIVFDAGPYADPTIKAGIFLLDQFWYNYAHWLLEVLPRLWSIERCADYRGLPLLINEKLYPQQLESLKLLNQDRHPLQVLPIGKRFRVERLIYPSSLTASMLMRYRPSAPASPLDVTLHPEAVGFLRERLLPICAPDATARRRLWVSRKTKRQAGHRRLINEDEIEAILVEHGFEVVVPETLSFREQVATFAEAEMIAGCAGAGMINCVFAPATARILMFTKNHPQVNFHYFTNIARTIGQPIAYVCGETLQNFGVHGFEADFTVDPAVARRAVREFLGA